MIVPDVNVLVYAFREGAVNHDAYADWLAGVVAGDEEIGLLDTVLTGLVRIVTNPRIVAPKADTGTALTFVGELRAAAGARWLGSSDAVWRRMATFVAADDGLSANHIPDAYIAAVAIEFGGRVATADRGFARYPGVQWFNPV